jgi:hypothetical protein
VFTARYALSPYIKQIRFVFKELINRKTNNLQIRQLKKTFLSLILLGLLDPKDEDAAIYRKFDNCLPIHTVWANIPQDWNLLILFACRIIVVRRMWIRKLSIATFCLLLCSCYVVTSVCVYVSQRQSRSFFPFSGTKSNSAIAPPYVGRSSWRCVADGVKS